MITNHAIIEELAHSSLVFSLPFLAYTTCLYNHMTNSNIYRTIQLFYHPLIWYLTKNNTKIFTDLNLNNFKPKPENGTVNVYIDYIVR